MNRYYESNNFAELLKQQPPELIKTLLREIKQFQATINNPDICSKNITLVVKLLYSVSKGLLSTNDVRSDAISVLSEVFDDRCHKFQQQLRNYVVRTILKAPFKEENLEIVCSMFELLLAKIPGNTWRLLPVDELFETVHWLEAENKLSDSNAFQMKCVNISELRDDMKEQQRPIDPIKSRTGWNGKWDNGEYRIIPIMPQWQEICDLNQPSKLRPNLVDGEYENWMHYFDVQFRLLREDFISPLRKGIQEYREGKTKKELSNIRLYDGVKMIKAECTSVGVCHEVKFNAPFKNYRWEYSKRLIYGSLVILSSDNFKRNALFGIVCGGNLPEGKVQIKFDQCAEAIMYQKMDTQFEMAESAAYFEATRHILRSLQQADPCTMPFTKYLIRSENDVIDPPKYLDSSLVQMKYNMKFIVNNDVLTRPGNAGRFSQVNVRDVRQWPHYSDCKIDESQWKAMKGALTQEVVAIQGPPGTGKTFLGLNIVQALLNNSAAWGSRTWNDIDSENGSPILVMCYTNFALDQFLEGIMESNKDKRIIRVGSRCKSEKLQKCNLKLARKHNYKKVPEEDHENMKVLEKEAKEISTECILEINKHKTLEMTFVSLSDIHPVISEHHYRSLLDETTSLEEQDYALELWLGLCIREAEGETAEGINFNEEFENAISDDVLRTVECSDSESDSDFSDTDVNRVGIGNYNSSGEFDSDPPLFDDMEIFQGLQPPVQKEKKKKKKKRGHKVRRTTKVVNSKYYETLELIEKSLTGEHVEVDYEEIEDVYDLMFWERVELYTYWHSMYKNYALRDLKDLCQRYNVACERYREAHQAIDRYSLETAHVIGMTTTAAARYQQVLHMVKPRIVIVEEAAEVLESHIVSALSAGTHHLILIGDHKQLRPKPNEYNLVINYNLDISLFERLVRNSFPHTTLENQHRMRPEIAELVKPHIYEILNDDDSVKKYPKVKGISCNMFLVCHTKQEKKSRDLSNENQHEINFILSLCQYLLTQEYLPNQITILVTYTGQLILMKNQMKSAFQGIRLCTVDDYQGEENDIILLSLVRSNKEGIVGFLKEENRVCVALSRAKRGFYCIGNFAMLRKNSRIWHKIVTAMELKGRVGEELPIHCSNHPTQIYYAKLPEDFNKYLPKGCCNLICNASLICGHKCVKTCHLNDREHLEYTCKQLCKRTCQNGHIRQSCCYTRDNCMILVKKQLPCMHTQKVHCFENPKDVHCVTLVCRIIPSCEHSQEMQCHDDVNTFRCKAILKKELPCSHTHDMPCHQNPLEVKCQVLVPKRLRCNHTQNVPCHQHIRYVLCKSLCEKPCSNGHPCEEMCHFGQLCPNCKIVVKKTLPVCGHQQSVPCNKNPLEIKCHVLVPKLLRCNHTQNVPCHQPTLYMQCKSLCKTPCSNGHPCKEICHIGKSCPNCKIAVNKILPVCGHQQSVLCHQNPLEVKCHTLVTKLLRCSHTQNAPCHQPTQYVRCKELCEKSCSNGHPCEEICHIGKSCPNCETAVKKTLPVCSHQQIVPCHQNLHKVKCLSQCRNPCKYNHPCQMICHKGSKCQDCAIKVEVTPTCSHTSVVKCSAKDSHTCSVMTSKHLNCGHTTMAPCSTEVSDIVCTTMVNKTIRKCGHTHLIQCSTDADRIICKTMVSVTLACGHEDEIQCSAEANDVICKQPVERTLKCGHKLKLACSVDPKLANCKKICSRPLGCGHFLKTECHMEFSESDCEELCSKLLPCGHTKIDKCNRNISDIVCKTICERELQCGHECKEMCAAKCKCYELISETLPHCGHSIDILCCQRHELSGIKCKKACSNELPCGHMCKMKCSVPCTQHCKETMIVICEHGHRQSKKCYAVASPCKEKCSRKLRCGHPCENLCYEDCMSKCKHLTRKEYPCGHLHRIPCYIPMEKMPCDLLCRFPLACGHICQNICRRCTSSRIHKPCTSSVTIKQYCGGKVRVPCLGSQVSGDRQTAPRSVQCKHENTVWNGSSIAIACSEPCQWSCPPKCPHPKSCTRPCLEFCDRNPCEEWCSEFLKCGHNCVSVCGEPCIKVCPICCPKEFANLLKNSRPFSNEEKYIQLPCGHIFTVSFMDEHVTQDLDTEVSPLQCPTCLVPLSYSFRYGNKQKESLNHVAELGEAIESKSIGEKRDKLFQTYKRLRREKTLPALTECLPLVMVKLHGLKKSADPSEEEMFVLILFAELCKIALTLPPSKNVRAIIGNLSSWIKNHLEIGQHISYQIVCDLLSEYYRLLLGIKVTASAKLGLDVEEHLTFLAHLNGNPNIRVSQTDFTHHSNLLDLKNDGHGRPICYQSTDEILDRVGTFHPVFKNGLWRKCKYGHYYCIPVTRLERKCVEVECHQCKGK